MHEYAMAMELVQRVIEEAESRHAVQVLKVTVKIGELAMLEKEQLQFNYEIIIADYDIMKKSTLEIIPVTAKVQCQNCGYQGPIHKIKDRLYQLFLPSLSCPKCESQVEIVEGRDFIIQTIDMEVP